MGSSYVPPAGCVSLTGSSMCPGFPNQYILPSNLSQSWSFFDDVDDVDSFDGAFLKYLGGQFKKTKYLRQLGCSGYRNVDHTLQYAQTVLCGEFSHISYSQSCYSAGRGTPPKLTQTCQVTCLQYAGSEQNLLSNSTICPTNTVGSIRDETINHDFVSCTEWGQLATNNTETCILGEVNEPNCGFGSEATYQTCNMCNPSQASVPSCCFSSGTNLGACGFSAGLTPSSISRPFGASSTSGTMALPDIPTAATSPAATVTFYPGTSGFTGGSDHNGLSAGAIAGIVLGSIIGALLLILIGLLFLLYRRRRRRDDRRNMMRTRPGGEESVAFATPYSPTSPTTAGPLTPRGGWGAGKASGDKSGEKSIATGLYAGTAAMQQFQEERQSSHGTTETSSTAEGRNVLSHYTDQYSGVALTPGSDATAIFAYKPNLPDELHLEPSAALTVTKIFDDGWAVGRLPSGQEGAFPLVCVTAGGLSSDEAPSSVPNQRAGTSRAAGKSGYDDTTADEDGGMETAPEGDETRGL